NFTPEVYRDYRIKVPFSGTWREILRWSSSPAAGCCFTVASWPLRARRHGVISDFEWTFVHFCLLPSFNADNDTPPGALCTVSVTLVAAGIGLVCDGDVAL